MKSVVLITGCSSGIGRSIAQLLAKNNYSVYAASRNMKDVNIKDATSLDLDLTNELSMKSAIKKVISLEGRLDILINNAGTVCYGPIENVSLVEARNQFEVNLFGTARLIQLALPFMKKKKKGIIINISSIAAKFSLPFGGWYHASKSALESYSDTLRMELKDYGIKVILIEPGKVDTRMSHDTIIQLRKYSNSSYSSLLNNEIMLLQNSKGILPSKVALKVFKCLQFKNPKPRYLVNYSWFLFLKWILPDEFFDKYIINLLKS